MFSKSFKRTYGEVEDDNYQLPDLIVEGRDSSKNFKSSNSITKKYDSIGSTNRSDGIKKARTDLYQGPSTSKIVCKQVIRDKNNIKVMTPVQKRNYLKHSNHSLTGSYKKELANNKYPISLEKPSELVNRKNDKVLTSSSNFSNYISNKKTDLSQEFYEQVLGKPQKYKKEPLNFTLDNSKLQEIQNRIALKKNHFPSGTTNKNVQNVINEKKNQVLSGMLNKISLIPNAEKNNQSSAESKNKPKTPTFITVMPINKSSNSGLKNLKMSKSSQLGKESKSSIAQNQPNILIQGEVTNKLVHSNSSKNKYDINFKLLKEKNNYPSKTEKSESQKASFDISSLQNGKSLNGETSKIKVKEFVIHFINDIYTSIRVSDELAKSMKCGQHYVEPKIENMQNGISSSCCWPFRVNLAFISSSVQSMMVDKIFSIFFKKKMEYHVMANYIIQCFPDAQQIKIRRSLPDYFSSTQETQNEEEDLGVAETFSDYKPSKLSIGHTHPDSVVETASLSSIEPPDITYQLSIPDEVIERRRLSSLQLETIVYAGQRHEQKLSDGIRAGFLIGDGAGVGKGRTIAGVIFENYLKGRLKSIWISVSNDLKFDAERDLRDIGAAYIHVHSLGKFSYENLTADIQGVLFATYAALIGKTKDKSENLVNTRLKQIVQWCGQDFDGLIIFDECHKAKNLIATGGQKPTQTGKAVVELQKALPNARVFYSSATGASEPKNMAYMTRLGIWGEGGAFHDFSQFQKSVNRRGVGVMEMIALDLKLRGAYLARQLSFREVTFRIEQVKITPKYEQMYDKACKLWQDVLQYYVELRELIVNPVEKKLMLSLFWAYHQRFFKYLCISAKIDHTVALIKTVQKEGKCVVIGLQMTGEASLARTICKEGQINNFISSAKCVLESIIERYSEKDIQNMGAGISPNAHSDTPKNFKKKKLMNQRKILLNDFSMLESLLPTNALDDLIDKLGGPEKVAEMTGRKGRVVQHDDGAVEYESRKDDEDRSMELVNMGEKKKFMDGVKEIAIISDASSTGVSLQSDLRVKNQKRRVHITLELPWSADKAVQQFGRTHRSNQANAPEYVLIISELGGEWRFASAVAKRLESLGALTHGDRRVTEARDMSSFNVESKYGIKALKRVLEDIYSKDENENLREALLNVQIAQEATVKTFLNRLLGLPVKIQNEVFRRFSSTHDHLIKRDKESGEYDSGTLDLGMGGQSCRPTNELKLKMDHQTGKIEATLYTVSVERGISWPEALQKYVNIRGQVNDGFYVSKHPPTFRKKLVCLAISSNKSNQFNIFKPNIGQGKSLTYDELRKKYDKLPDTEKAEQLWNAVYQHTRTKCQHSYSGFCRSRGKCLFGLRSTTFYILCGLVMKVWTELEKLFSKAPAYCRTMRIMRLKTFDGKRLVGVRIPPAIVGALKEKFNDLCDPNKQILPAPDLKEQIRPGSSNELNLNSTTKKPPTHDNSKTQVKLENDKDLIRNSVNSMTLIKLKNNTYLVKNSVNSKPPIKLEDNKDILRNSKKLENNKYVINNSVNNKPIIKLEDAIRNSINSKTLIKSEDDNDVLRNSFNRKSLIKVNLPSSTSTNTIIDEKKFMKSEDNNNISKEKGKLNTDYKSSSFEEVWIDSDDSMDSVHDDSMDIVNDDSIITVDSTDSDSDTDSELMCDFSTPFIERVKARTSINTDDLNSFLTQSTNKPGSSGLQSEMDPTDKLLHTFDDEDITMLEDNNMVDNISTVSDEIILNNGNMLDDDDEIVANDVNPLNSNSVLLNKLNKNFKNEVLIPSEADKDISSQITINNTKIPLKLEDDKDFTRNSVNSNTIIKLKDFSSASPNTINEKMFTKSEGKNANDFNIDVNYMMKIEILCDNKCIDVNESKIKPGLTKFVLDNSKVRLEVFNPVHEEEMNGRYINKEEANIDNHSLKEKETKKDLQCVSVNNASSISQTIASDDEVIAPNMKLSNEEKKLISTVRNNETLLKTEQKEINSIDFVRNIVEDSDSLLRSGTSLSIQGRKDDLKSATAGATEDKLITIKSEVKEMDLSDNAHTETKEFALDYEDISCINETKCSLNEINQLLGLVATTSESKSEGLNNWKDTLRDLNSNVKRLQECLNLQFGLYPKSSE